MKRPQYQALRRAIQETYIEYDTPADKLVVDNELATKFTESVNSRLEAKLRLSVKECNSITLSLRKKGAANDGLPSLRNGHGPSAGSRN